MYSDKEVNTQEVLTISMPNIGALKYIKQILIDPKEEINGNTVLGDFIMPLWAVDRLSRQRISKETSGLSSIDQTM